MRRLRVAIVIFVLTVSVGCGKSIGGSSLENEAVKRAKELWALTQIGGEFYLCETRDTGKMMESKTIYELRNPKTEILPKELNAADKLNGVEWAGAVELKADAFRLCRTGGFQGVERGKTWTDWVLFDPLTVQYNYKMRVSKTKGEWMMVPGTFIGATIGPTNVNFKQVQASDLPQ